MNNEKFKFIYSPYAFEGCPIFSVKKRFPFRIKKAYAYVTALGVFDLIINGKKCGNAFLMPGWTSEKRLMAVKFDITRYIFSGENLFEILAGNGYALGDISSHHYRENGKIHFFDRIEVAAKFVIVSVDGRRIEFGTGNDWAVSSSPVVFSDIYQGEIFNATKIPEAFGFAETDESEKPKIVGFYGGKVHPHERFSPIKIFTDEKGEKIIDFGQNLAGYTEIKYIGKKGDRIKLSHGEVLDKNGNFYNGNLQWAKAVTEYVCDGKTQIYRPHFSYQGFRYVRIDEFDGDISSAEFTAVALYTNMEQTCFFGCSDSRLNKLFSNILWGQKSNFLNVPTDCPQRSERFGWTGDSQVFCKTAAINFNVKSFYDRWLTDMSLDQGEDGSIPSVIPAVFRGIISAGWGDAATVCPWELYIAYGDKKMLSRHFGMMEKWVNYVRRRAQSFGSEYLWTCDEHYGDWLAMDESGQLLGSTQTDLIASAFYYKSAVICGKAAAVLGKTEKAEGYFVLSEKIKSAFMGAFLKDGLPVVYNKGDGDPNSPHPNVYSRTVSNDTQTAISLILNFGLCLENERGKLASRLNELVIDAGGISTGFIGTPQILYALSENGYAKTAYDLLLSDKMPSWLFPVKQGATTVWERWNGIDENGEFENPDMNSFNHFAYGSVFGWIYNCALGIKPTEDGTGYSKIKIEPTIDERIPEMHVKMKTVRGILTAEYSRKNEKIEYKFGIPEGCSATITLPCGKTFVLEGQTSFCVCE
mgnify:FL=1